MKYYTEYLVFWCAYCPVFLHALFEHQKENLEETERFKTNWWDSEPWMSDHQIPALMGPPLQKANFERPHGKIEQIRPPAPLEQIHPPALRSQSTSPAPNIRQQNIENDHLTRVHAEDIKCIRSNGLTIFTASVIPPQAFTSLPVFEDAGNNYSPSDCDMRSTLNPRTFDMHVHHFTKCGVRIQQDTDGKEWISVTLRFPFVEGLRMAEDEYVMIMCRPQERIAITHHVMDIRGVGKSEERSIQRKKVFRSSSPDVSCKIALMTGQSFNKEVKAAVRVGQDMQIRAIVKDGDGWNYAMLKEIIVSRASVHKEEDNAQPNNYFQDFSGENAVYSDKRKAHSLITHSAQLVFNNGCRNPMYKAIAHGHPQRDSNNPLIVSFTFKAFMFQNMVEGEALRLSTKVVACADLADCQPRYCDGDLPRNPVVRKRRESMSQRMNQTKNFTEDFEFFVELGGFTKTPFTSSVDGESIPQEILEDKCRFLLVTLLSGAILFCLFITGAVTMAMVTQRRKWMASKELKR